MPEMVQCKFHLVRYVPDLGRGEFVNIGVMLTDIGVDGSTQIRLTRDWSRLRGLDPDADMPELRRLEASFAEGFAERTPGTKSFLAFVENTLSVNVQITKSSPYLCESVPQGIGELMQTHVLLRKPRPGTEGGREAIADAIFVAFESAGLAGEIKRNLPVEPYTWRGDPMRIDCGIQVNNSLRLCQAVSLDGNLDAVKALAWTASRMRHGVKRIIGADFALAAVVRPPEEVGEEPEEEDSAEIYEFAANLLAEESISLVPISALPTFAERIRAEISA